MEKGFEITIKRTTKHIVYFTNKHVTFFNRSIIHLLFHSYKHSTTVLFSRFSSTIFPRRGHNNRTQQILIFTFNAHTHTLRIPDKCCLRSEGPSGVQNAVRIAPHCPITRSGNDFSATAAAADTQSAHTAIALLRPNASAGARVHREEAAAAHTGNRRTWTVTILRGREEVLHSRHSSLC